MVGGLDVRSLGGLAADQRTGEVASNEDWGRREGSPTCEPQAYLGGGVHLRVEKVCGRKALW